MRSIFIETRISKASTCGMSIKFYFVHRAFCDAAMKVFPAQNSRHEPARAERRVMLRVKNVMYDVTSYISLNEIEVFPLCILAVVFPVPVIQIVPPILVGRRLFCNLVNFLFHFLILFS